MLLAVPAAGSADREVLPGGGARRRRLNGAHGIADVHHLLLQFAHLAGNIGHGFAQGAERRWSPGSILVPRSTTVVTTLALLVLDALLEVVLQQRDRRIGLVGGVERLLHEHLNGGEFLVLGALQGAHLFLQKCHVPLQFDDFLAGSERQGRDRSKGPAAACAKRS